MAVYKRTYAAYEGSFTPSWSRFLILPRYSFARLWQSKFLVMFFMACFFYPLGCVGYVYLANNLSILSGFGIPTPLGKMLKVEPSLFLYFCWVQAAFTYLLTAFVGPSLVSPDLVNGAMPLYLYRPFSRTEYIAGKMSVLVFLLSLVTWVPGLILFAIQASLAGWEWTRTNFWIAGSIFMGLAVWIPVALPAGAGDFGLDQVEDRGRSAGVGRVLRGRGLRLGAEQRNAHQVRHTAEPDRSHVHGVDQALPHDAGYWDLGRIRLDLPGRSRRHLPVDAGAPRAGF